MGSLYKKYIEKFNIQTFVIGNPRVKKLPKRHIYRPTKKNNLLILLDLHNWKSIVDDLSKLSHEYNVYVKPHPFTQKILNNYLITNNIKINQIKNDQSSTIDFDGVLCSDSGIAIEYALSGWPVFIIKNKDFTNYSPLALENNKIQIFELSKEGIEKILNKLNDEIGIKQYKQNLENLSKLHWSEIGLAAEKKFKDKY